jgi:hypothetical protein
MYLQLYETMEVLVHAYAEMVVKQWGHMVNTLCWFFLRAQGEENWSMPNT